MEFNLAQELQKPILACVHDAPDQIPVGKAELNPESRRRLDEFRDRVSKRLYKGWNNKDGLKAAVIMGLVHLTRTKPAMGWVRNEGLQNHELLQRLAHLQEKYDKLETEANELRKSADARINSDRFEDLDQTYTLSFRTTYALETHTVEIKWLELFYALADELLIPCAENKLKDCLKPSVVHSLPEEKIRELTKTYGSVTLEQKSKQLVDKIEVNDEILGAILRQLMAKGLVEPQLILRQGGDERRTYTTPQRCWALTAAGKELYLEKRAFRK